jgi:hypothetical protein
VKRLLFIAPMLAALTLTACGGSSSGGGSTGAQSSASASSGSSTTQSGGQRGFMSDEVQECLKKQGIELPQGGFRGGDGQPPQGADGQPPEGYGPPGGGLPGGGEAPEGATPPDGAGGGFGGSDEDRQKLQDAMKACGVEMPAQGQGGGGFQRPDVNDGAYQNRVNAYVACVRENGFDLPDPDFSGDGPIFDPDKVDQSDKTFQAASAKCQDELRPQASSSTTSATS